MFLVKKITLNNFGPFKGKQELEFAEDNGVIIIFGENGRGKTTLLNAIRFALFGKVVGRGSKEIEVSKLVNWEAQEEGVKTASVELDFTFNDKKYVLTRTIEQSNGRSKTFTTDEMLQVDGNFLNKDQLERELASIMPEEVSRFFLFDGELLQEYEDLLLDEDPSGKGIKRSIERILGVPILKNSIAHLEELLKSAKKEENKTLQKEKQTQEIAKELTIQEEAIQKLEYEREKSEKLLSDLKRDKLSLESVLRENEVVEKLIVKRDRIEKEKQSTESEFSIKIERLKEHSKNFWKVPIKSKLEARKKTLEEMRNNLLIKFEENVRAELTNSFRKNCIETNMCPICNSGLNENAIMKIRATIDDKYREVNLGTSEFFTLNHSISNIAELERGIEIGLINEIVSDVSRLKAKIEQHKMDLKEINESISDYGAEEISEAKSKLQSLIKQIIKAEEGIQVLDSQLLERRSLSENLRKKAQEMGDGLQSKDTKRRVVYENLTKLFSSALVMYRDKLKTHVEWEASELFKQLSHDKDYDKLKINDNYGLTIVHKDGGEILLRSAGFEHIVALSLMGSLQKNAPLRGPIFMDSPMGRLDGKHKANVVSTLPKLSQQVILLIYADEFDAKEARKILGTTLLKEYELKRISSKYTKIEVNDGR